MNAASKITESQLFLESSKSFLSKSGLLKFFFIYIPLFTPPGGKMDAYYNFDELVKKKDFFLKYLLFWFYST